MNDVLDQDDPSRRPQSLFLVFQSSNQKKKKKSHYNIIT
jgi:hypothetical protein